jgi:hypothetical protein
VLPSELVWIEETFADRDKRPSGNLRERGATLGIMAAYFGGLQIATRTIQPPVVKATLRDVGRMTDLYVGTEGVGAKWLPMASSSGVVPDRRTVMIIGGGQ